MAKLDKQNVEDIVSLTPIQKGILFHYLKEPQSDEYFEQISLRIEGSIDVEMFKKAWNIVVQTNEQLRTVFRWDKVKEPIQVVLKKHEPKISYYDFRKTEPLNNRSNVQAVKKEDMKKKFDLRYVPFRITLCKLEEDVYELIISNHHILYDGWSNGIILKEFLQAYESLANLTEINIPNKKKYKDFVKFITSQDKNEQKVFWEEYLNGFDSPSMLEQKRARTDVNRSDRHISINLSKKKLDEFSKTNQVTLASLIYTIWGLVLQKNNRTNDVVFGTTLSGRAGTFSGIENMVGLFINTLPLRVTKKSGDTSADLVKSVNKTILDWERYGHTPLPDIKRYSQINDSTELFDSIVVFENYPLDQKVLNKESAISFHSYSAFEMTNYELTISVISLEDIEVTFSYNEQLFKDDFIENLSNSFKIITDQILQNKPLDEIETVSKEEKNVILKNFNNTSKPANLALTVTEMFKQQVNRTPDQAAVVYKDQSLTYSELDHLTNKLSHTLLSNGVSKGDIIGIMTNPSINMIAGILAIIKSGAAYMPIDPQNPEDRTKHMLLDTNCRFLLTDTDSVKGNDYIFEDFHNTLLCLDDENNYSSYSESPTIDLTGSDLFTVFYTSGTTGKPKGVLIEHKNVINVVEWFGNTYEMGKGKNLLQLTNYVFDPSVEDFFGTLLFGSTLHIAEGDLIQNTDSFCEYVNKHQIHIINFIPTVLKGLLCHDRKLPSLKTVISGGEALEESLKDELIQRGYDLYNNYGPTETTVDALSKKCTPGKVTLGKPVSNVRCYVMDQDRNLNPIGVSGELYIAGSGVARGYLNLEKTTEESFYTDPFYPNERMYKTGDIARWLPEGEIEFLGRADQQVKIRGYRIELGEITHSLLIQKNIIDATVIDWENQYGNKVLCAYVVSDQEVNVQEIKEQLKEKLPEYMVPHYFIQIDKIPLTSIGKIDRKNLPEPAMDINKVFTPPITNIEKELVEIWSSVLGIDQKEISTSDNFFELGGDSILSIQIAGRCIQKGIEMSVNKMFQYPTISELANAVNWVGKEEKDVQAAISGEVSLTPIQKWFFNQNIRNWHHWNQSILLETGADIEPEKLKLSLIKLTEYHDSFRLRFQQKENKWVQWYAEGQSHILFNEYDMENQAVNMEEVINELQCGLNITEGPLIRAAYFKYGSKTEGKLFITAHHLVVDGYSWRIILEDLHNIYGQLDVKGEVQLPAKSISFKEWSEKLYEFANSTKLKNEVEYWKEQIPPSLDPIPIDFKNGPNDEKSANTLSYTLTANDTDYLLHKIHDSFNTRVDDILLSGLSQTLGNWSGKTLVDLEGHGRTPLLKEHDTSRTVGWFTCVYPMVLGDLHSNNQTDGLIMQTKERYRNIPNSGVGFEILQYLSSEEIRSEILLKPKAQISFNYLGQSRQIFKDKNTFKISDVNSGIARDLKGLRSHLIDIDCMIVNGQLRIDWKYSENTHKKETIDTLANEYINRLREIIHFCKSVHNTHFTPTDFPLVSINQKQIDYLFDKFSSIEDILSLSPVQKSMVFHNIYSPDSSVAVEQTIFSIISDLDVQVFKEVWQTLLNRHESLRASYHWEDLEEPVQVVHKDLDVPFKFFNWSQYTESERSDLLEKYIEKDRQTGFDISNPPLMRITVIQEGDQAFEVIWTHHHLQLDGWCNSILLKEIGELYNAYCAGAEIDLGDAVPYKEYVKWLCKQDDHNLEIFWKEQLKGFKTPLRFGDIFTKKAEVTNSPTYGDVIFNISSKKKEELQNFAKDHKLTLSTLIQGAWAILLNQYSNESDVVFGVTSSGRPADLNRSDQMIGCFMNTLPFRTKLHQNMSLTSWLKDLQLKLVEMRQYEHASLADIRKWSEVPRNSALYDLYESIVIVENYPFDEALKDGIGKLQVESVRVEEQMDYPIVLYCNLQPELHFKLLYDRRFLNEKEARQLITHLTNILWEMMRGHDIKMNDITMLSEYEKSFLLKENNQTHLDYPHACFHDLFAEQVKKRNNEPAVIQGDQVLTYKEMDTLSNQLAHKLIREGIGPDSPVGIYLERSPKMAVCILAILKAGGAFLPIDADYPGDRVNLMLTDAKVPILLSQSSLVEKVPVHDGNTILIDKEWDTLELEPKHTPNTEVKPDNLAYVIYTSGSSGKPKGVMMPHEAVVSHSIDIINQFNLVPEDRVLQFSSISFDISLEQIFSTFAAGSTLVFRDKDLWTPSQFSKRCAELDLSVINLPTSYWAEIVQAWHSRPQEIPDCNLKIVVVGGEQMPAEKVKLWEQMKLEHVNLLNAYGPAETAMTSTLYKVSGNGTKSGDLKFIPVGKPLANRRIYILNDQLKPVPAEVKGEIHIGGIPLARGYLNKPQMTQDKFIEDPYHTGYGSKLYKTGDIGKVLPDGNIQVLGRKDDQLKIRGHRIDIGEIEATLSQYKQFTEAVVVAKERDTGEKYLVMFYVTSSNDIDKASIRTLLAKKVPEYMIPSFFLKMDKFPLSPNGKIDRKALSAMKVDVDFAEQVQKPTNEIQKRLLDIWEKILGIKGIGINHHFFEVGGQSLSAITLVSKINMEFGVELPLADVFESPTIAELSLIIEKTKKVDNKYLPITLVDKKAYYEVSPAQKRMYIVDQLADKNISYNISGAVVLEGDVNASHIEKTFQMLINRHESLRTSFDQVNGEVVQRVHDEVSWSMEHFVSDEENISEVIESFIRPFNLNDCPLFRVGLIKVSSAKFVLAYDMHHIIADGLSVAVLIREFASLYENQELPPINIQYKDFSSWQNELIKSGYFDKQKHFWLKTFSGNIPLLDLPTDFTRPESALSKGDSISFRLDSDLSKRLKQFSKENGVTLYTLLLSAFTILLAKHSGQDDIVVGTPVAGRTQAEMKSVVGMFVNTLPLRSNPKDNLQLGEFIKKVAASTVEALENQDYPFEMLVDDLDILRSLNHHPLFDVMFAFENVDNAQADVKDFEIKPFDISSKSSKFDLELKVTEQDKQLQFVLEYNKGLFAASSISRMANHLLIILNQIADDPKKKIGAVNLVTPEENYVIERVNDTEYNFPSEKTVKQLFEEQAIKHSSRVVLVTSDGELTYSELNKQANKLAHTLISKGFGPDKVIGLYAQPSVELMVGLLAIIKTGAAYLPIDPEFPDYRISLILDQSRPQVILAQSHLLNSLDSKYQVLELEDESIYTNDSSNPANRSTSDNNLYVIYTSGTTGVPKGVPIKNKSVVNYITWFSRVASLSFTDKTILLSSFAFDLGYTSLYSSLLNGSELHLLTREEYSIPDNLLKYLADRNISYIKLTPSLFTHIVNSNSLNKYQSELDLKMVVLGGEKLSSRDVLKFSNLYPNTHIMNHYGPTESTIGSVARIINFMHTKEQLVEGIIGQPIDNTQVYVLDKIGNVLPLGVKGEICIAGIGVTEGYINDSALNTEKFIKLNKKGEQTCLYKTGDIGRLTHDGQIEYFGRMDNQIKIKGYRVELEEIITVLKQHSAVRDAVVVPMLQDDNREQELVAYMVLTEEEDGTGVREFLSQSLPYYMRPSKYIRVNLIPLKPNGKVDVRGLSRQIEMTSIPLQSVEPTDPVDLKISDIWKKILDVDKTGLNESFFELGGNSLKLMQVTVDIHKEFRVNIPLRESFKNPTIAGMGKFIKDSPINSYSSIEPVKNKRFYDLSSAQKRMYVLQQMEGVGTAYNMPRATLLEGELSLTELQRALNELISRNEALRTSFKIVNGEPKQHITDEVKVEIEVIEAGESPQSFNSSLEHWFEDFIRPFELHAAPLIRVKLIQLSWDTHMLLTDMHHIISDGHSVNVMLEELAYLYEGRLLQDKTIQYKDFAVWQNKFLQSPEANKQKEYWLSDLSGELPVLNIPTDYPRPELQNFEGESLTFNMGIDLKKRLEEFCYNADITMNMLISAAYSILLSKYTSQEEIVIGLPIIGRGHFDTQNMIGMFANTIVLRSFPEKNKTFEKFLLEVKDKLIKAYDNQDVQFDMLLDMLDIRRENGRNPIFSTMLALQDDAGLNRFIGDIKLTPVQYHHKISKFDFSLYVDIGENIEFELEYAKKLFKHETIEKFAKDIFFILETAVTNQDIKLKDIDVDSLIVRNQEIEEVMFKF
ncbi:Polyketide synthase module protein [Bacillus sp. ZZV12-4809]|nr:Polyketide synthase module protein [Bacillus sp. ZZV12-4809]